MHITRRHLKYNVILTIKKDVEVLREHEDVIYMRDSSFSRFVVSIDSLDHVRDALEERFMIECEEHRSQDPC